MRGGERPARPLTKQFRVAPSSAPGEGAVNCLIFRLVRNPPPQRGGVGRRAGRDDGGGAGAVVVFCHELSSSFQCFLSRSLRLGGLSTNSKLGPIRGSPPSRSRQSCRSLRSSLLAVLQESSINLRETFSAKAHTEYCQVRRYCRNRHDACGEPKWELNQKLRANISQARADSGSACVGSISTTRPFASPHPCPSPLGRGNKSPRRQRPDPRTILIPGRPG